MDPFTIAIIGGGLLSAYGKYEEGQATKDAANYNADVAEQNIGISIQKAQEDERRTRVMGAKALGDIRSSYGASGVTAEGSALDVLQESAANVEFDALNVRHEGEMRAVAYQNEANFQRYRAGSAGQAGFLGAASTILTAGGRAGKGN